MMIKVYKKYFLIYFSDMKLNIFGGWNLFSTKNICNNIQYQFDSSSTSTYSYKSRKISNYKGGSKISAV